MAGPDAQLIGRWDDFTGGHWGGQGAGAAPKNGWGGKNMMLDRSGTLAPACASRPLVFTNLGQGQVRGVFWAWGADGRVYFLQESGANCQLRRFTPNFKGVPIVVENVGATLPSCPRVPAWAVFSHNVYLSIYSVGTYEINTTTPSLTKMTTAGIGDVPGGRAIVGFGERFLVAGIADARMGTQGNRVTFSEPADSDNFPDINYFDVGNDNIEIAGIYVQQDVLIIIFSDQTIWTYRGVPGGTATLRRSYGYHATSGGISTFTHENAAVDPNQNRLWMFDHVSRGPARFSGATFGRVPGFGMLTVMRTAVEDTPDGQLVCHGGPDDVVIDRVAVPRTSGAGADGESNELVRVNGAFALVDQTVLTGG